MSKNRDRSQNEDSQPQNYIVETYENGLAAGAETIRWWAHEKILVGGSILSPADWRHLKADYKCGGVLSVEGERHDGDKQIDGPYLHVPAPDDGLAKPGEWWAQIFAFSVAYYQVHGAPLYVHSQTGGGRAAAAAYGIMRVAFRMSQADALSMIQKTLPQYGQDNRKNYLASCESTIALMSGAFAPASGTRND